MVIVCIPGVWSLFAFLVCVMVKLPWLFGTVVVLFVEVRGIVSIAVSSRVCVSNV